MNRLDNDRVRGVLAQEAGAAAGSAIRVQLREGQPPQRRPQENLQELLEFSRQFDNIEIKYRR